jgi:acetolactate synthase small subunit
MTSAAGQEERIRYRTSKQSGSAVPAPQIDMLHTISILVANQPGELSRIVGLFSSRGFNIETICVGKTLEAAMSRCTIVTSGDERTIEQILK